MGQWCQAVVIDLRGGAMGGAMVTDLRGGAMMLEQESVAASPVKNEQMKTYINFTHP